MKVFAGKLPFEGLPPCTLITKVMGGDRPERPEDLTEDVWSLMQWCWQPDPHQRPEMSTVLQHLTPSLFRTLHKLKKCFPEIQAALHQFYDSTERGACIGGLNDVDLMDFVELLDDVRPPFYP